MSSVLSADAYEVGTAKAVRSEGRVPAVVYGRGKETKNISVDRQDFRRAYRKVGKAMLLDIDVNGEKTPTLVYSVDIHPVTGDPIHVDFHAVDMNEEVTATVPIKLTGTSDAVKLLGGVLTHAHNEVQIKCLPKNLLVSMEISLEPLKTFHDSITVADLPFPEGITVLDAPETVIASVSAPRLAQEEIAAEKEEGTEGEAKEEKKEE